MRRRQKDKSIRKIFKSGGSYAVTLPVELVEELKWKEKQKLVAKKRGKSIIISDWPVSAKASADKKK